MNDALQRRVLKAAVFGNSIPLWVDGRDGRGDASYAQWLEELLHRAGIKAVVSNEARYNQLIDEALCQYETTMRTRDLDVVVLHYGMGECWPGVIPWALNKLMSTWHVHPGRGMRRLHRLAIAHVWPRVRKYQRWATGVVGQRTYHLGPKRFERELVALVEDLQRELGALVLLVGLTPPGPKLLYLMPGVDERSARFDAILRTTAERMGPNVRHLDLYAHFAGREAQMSSDSVHLSAAGHRVVGELLADEVLSWDGLTHVSRGLPVD